MMLWEHFDKNEIYLSIAFVIVYAIFFLLPKRFPRDVTMMYLVWGFAIATLFDFTIGGGLINFYQVNDSGDYELFDVVTYFMFAPISYFFIYIYDALGINKKTVIGFIIVWTIIGLGAEWVSSVMGVTHHQRGYQIPYSVPVFLVVQTITLLYYELIMKFKRQG
ncbi:hypothetical protein [Tuberibacillus sp. Marseille-P3662]|uniref:hypothetical protein n=1 Tax=Tuberibacillus sp. Marseille-P3662 TaxID=1965358 RepID=UPI000A1CA2DA|nr:hypothetical protein [Tuberibacillus sp. Marseille-P3662]